MNKHKSTKRKLDEIEYFLITEKDGRREVEIDLENQSLDEKTLGAILKKEFGDPRKRNLFFYVESTILVVGQIDWLEESRKN